MPKRERNDSSMSNDTSDSDEDITTAKRKKSRQPVFGNFSCLKLKQTKNRVDAKSDCQYKPVDIKLRKKEHECRSIIKGQFERNINNPKHKRYKQFRHCHRKAFNIFQKSVGKLSGIPDFNKTIGKTFNNLRQKRKNTAYLGSKSRCPKLRYLVLKHLVNYSVQRKDSTCVFHVENLSLTLNRRQLLCPLTVTCARFNKLHPQLSMSYQCFRKIYGLINGHDKVKTYPQKKRTKTLFRQQIAGKKSDIVCGKCVRMEWQLGAVNKEPHEVSALLENLKTKIVDFINMRKLKNRQHMTRLNVIESEISNWIKGAMQDCSKDIYRFRSLEMRQVGDDMKEVPVWLDLSRLEYSWLLLHRIIGSGDSNFKSIVPQSCPQSGYALHILLLEDLKKEFKAVTKPSHTRQLRSWGDYATEWSANWKYLIQILTSNINIF